MSSWTTNNILFPTPWRTDMEKNVLMKATRDHIQNHVSDSVGKKTYASGCTSAICYVMGFHVVMLQLLANVSVQWCFVFFGIFI